MPIFTPPLSAQKPRWQRIHYRTPKRADNLLIEFSRDVLFSDTDTGRYQCFRHIRNFWSALTEVGNYSVETV